MNTWHIVQNYY